MVGLCLLFVNHFRVMRMPHPFDHVEYRQPITFDVLPWLHVTLKDALHMRSINAFKNFHLRKANGFIMGCGHDEDRDFACSAASLVSTFIGATFEKGIIDLDQAGELVLSVSGLHCLTNFVEHHLGTFDADIELSRQGQGGIPPLVGAQ